MRRHWMLLLASLVAVFGTFLRLLSPGRIGIWRDEAQSIAIASMESPRAVLSFLYHHESHPPLYYLLGHFAQRMAGAAEGFYTALSLVCSLISIPAAGLLARRVGSRGAGLLAAGMVALSMPVVLFSVQLRPYALLALLWLVSSAAVHAAWTQPTRSTFLLWAASSTAAVYISHATAMLLLAQAASTGMVLLKRRARRHEVTPWLAAAGALLIAMVPVLLMLLHQARNAPYPPPQPVRPWTPWLSLLSAGLSFPLEVLLPMVVGTGAAVRLATNRHADAVADAFIMLPALTLAGLAIGSYRSQLLQPHLLVALAPLALSSVAVAIGRAWTSRERVRAAILGEAVVVSACLGFLFAEGVMKTNTDLIAQAVAAESLADDLVVLVPGAAGASFGRTSGTPRQRIDFPLQRPVTVYEFDNDFTRVSDTAALDATLSAARQSLQLGRRTWLITLARWKRTDSLMPRALSEREFGGLGVADRIRANQIRKELIAMGYREAMLLSPDSAAKGMELMKAELFAPAPPSELEVISGRSQ